MKISLLQENLSQALQYLQKAIPAKPQLPILASVLCTANEKGLTVAATDLYFGVRTTVPANCEVDGVIAVPGKELKEVVNSLSPGPMSLEFSEGTLTIKNKTSRITLQCHASEEYPPFPNLQQESREISSGVLQIIDTAVSFAASTDQARPVLTSVLIEQSESGLLAVCTDGFRLSKLLISELQLIDSPSLLIPAAALKEVCRIIKNKQVSSILVSISQELKQALFVIESTEVYVRLIEGEYPPYERIIPSEFKTEVTCATQELIAALKSALIFARDASNIVVFAISSEKVLLKATSPTLGTYEGEVAAAFISGDEVSIAFNARYILEYLQAHSSETITIQILESLKPARFIADSMKNQEYVVMPFKVQG